MIGKSLKENVPDDLIIDLGDQRKASIAAVT